MRIVIASTFTAEPIADALDFWASVLSIPATIVVSPYNQVFQQLLDPISVLRSNNGGLNLIFVRVEDWVAHNYDSSRGCRDANYFIEGIKASASNGHRAFIILFCPCSPKFAADPERKRVVSDFETLIITRLSGERGVFIVGSDRLRRDFGDGSYSDEESEKLGAIPYSDEFMAFLGTTAMRKFAQSQRKPHKVVVLDCDQTLWKGVCGEDGVEGIRISPGHAFLQSFMIEQHLLGRLLCLCSKNNPLDVDEVFRTHPDMLLQQHHILASRIGWLPKSDSIRSLAVQLRLDLDSFIFLDDDPAECAQMRADCPEVLTIQVPSDSECIPSTLRNIWAFDAANITDEDRNRHTFYQKEIQRSELKTSSLSLNQFMIDLNLETSIRLATSDLASRISQLTKRTNQFNLNGARYSESEIVSLMSASICLAIDAKDRFGNYGTIGAAICISNMDEFCLTGLWVSCRALGRGIEHRIVKDIVDRASTNGFASMHISYAETSKNAPARIFLDEIGARELPHTGGRTLEFAQFSQFPDENLRQHPDIPREHEESHVSYCAPWQTVERIATEWSDPKNVVTAIREYKRRCQSARN